MIYPALLSLGRPGFVMVLMLLRGGRGCERCSSRGSSRAATDADHDRVSNFTRAWGPVGLIGAALAIAGFQAYWRRLTAPLGGHDGGPLFRCSATRCVKPRHRAIFARAMRRWFKQCDLVQSIHIARAILGNKRIDKRRLDRSRQGIKRGEGIAEPIRPHGRMSYAAAHLLNVGPKERKTGKLDAMFTPG